ncbi:MAG: DUF6020 family protein [Eubacterium sp.]|nr:DUF6020 family protein [Eubacterium sp.]
MKRKVFAILWTSLWFTLFTYLSNDDLTWSLLLFFPGYVAVCSIMAIAGEKLRGRIDLFAWENRIVFFLKNTLSDRMLLLNIWFIILLCWIPAWLSFFPGTFGYDAPIQFAMYTGDVGLTSANPLLHTWLLGGIISLGKAVFGSYQAGFTLFIILQVLLVSNCMANMVLFLIRKHVPLTIILAGLLWTITHPVIQILNLNSTKDILCGVFLAFFTMAFWDILEEKGTRKISDYIKLFFFGLMICLMRNAALYLLAALLIISLFVRLKDKKIYAALSSVIVCVEIFSFVCSSVFEIPKGDMRENLCIPIQQLAYVTYMYENENPEVMDISEEDTESLAELFLGVEALESEYDPLCVDFPKERFRTAVFKSDPKKYISLYFRLGTKYPSVYLKAIKYLILPYWYMDENIYHDSELAYDYTFSELNHWGIQLQYLKKLHPYRIWLRGKVNTLRFPLWRHPGLCIWLLTALSGWMIARKEKRGLLKILPLSLYFVGILLGPVALLRYLYPLMLTTPLLFGLMFRREAG